MVDVIRQNRARIQVLCQAHGVRRLELIGSAARGTFDPAHSDFDFLIEFDEAPLRQLSHHYFGVLFGLEDLLKRRVDLIRVSSDSDPRFLAVAKRHVDVIYDAGSPQAA